MILPAGFVDTARCPLCGQGNGCAMASVPGTGQTQLPCWCMAQKIPVEVLVRLPTDARGLACVCQRCAATQPSQDAA